MNAQLKSTPSFGETTRLFREARFPEKALIPIAPHDAQISGPGSLNPKSLGKAPGKYIPHKQAWCGLAKNSDGARYIREGATEQDVRERASSPTRNVGILGRYIPAIDSDAASEDARQLVEDALVRFLGKAADNVAERVRGDVPRRLYAFEHVDPDDTEGRVQCPSLQYWLPGDPGGKFPHAIDFIGYGKQFVAAGVHHNGRDRYKWRQDFDLCDLYHREKLTQIDNAGMHGFRAVVIEMIEGVGGKVQKGGLGGGGGELRDYSADEPAMAVDAIFQGLKSWPNNREHFESHESFVSILSKILAALGREAEVERERVQAWACEDLDLCPEDYFERTWNSFGGGVGQKRHALTMFFKDKGVVGDFPALTEEDHEIIASSKKDTQVNQDALLDEFIKSYAVGEVNYETDHKNPMLRRRKEPNRSENLKEWWQLRTGDLNIQFVQKLRSCGRYSPDEAGMWDFFRDLKKERPDAVFTGTTLHPHYDRGEITVEENPDGRKIRKLNLRFQAPAIRHAKKDPRNPEQAASDLKVLLRLQELIFGDDADYERDLLAYMAQTGKRPGSFLYLVGEPGVGKSLYTSVVRMLFDGPNRNQGMIDGTKIVNESSRRFAFANVEGCRCVIIQELPDNVSTKAQAEIMSNLKQRVDIGSDGDYVQDERKNTNIDPTQNFARYFVTTNYENALPIEPNDRRAFYVRCVVTTETRPAENFYAEVAAITDNPERLATYWRYLLKRDWRNYNPAKAPPLSNGKKGAQIRAMPIPIVRHTAAAIEHLADHGRIMFDLEELERLVSDMGENECRNTGGVGDRERYDFHRNLRGPEQKALDYVRNHAVKIGTFKTADGKKRLSPIYVFKKAEALKRLSVMDRDDLLEALDRDRMRHPPTKRHPLRDYAYPTELEDNGSDR